MPVAANPKKPGPAMRFPSLSSLITIARQFSAFSLVGVIGTIVHYGTMALLIEVASWSPAPGSAGGFLTSAVVSYWLNYKVTFASAVAHHKALPKFLLVGSVGLGINTLLVGVLTSYAKLHWLGAQVIATATVLCWNFAGNRVWTFSERESPVDQPGRSQPQR